MNLEIRGEYFLSEDTSRFFMPFFRDSNLKRMEDNTMSSETMRIFFPLKIVSYPQYDCSEDEREDISPKEL